MTTALEAMRLAVDALEGVHAGEHHGGVDESIAALRTAIAQLETQGWQPIESAPRDGTQIIIFNERTRNKFVDGLYESDSAALCRAVGQTHWMTLPPAPDAAMEEQKHG